MTEEIYSWRHDESVHTSSWPEAPIVEDDGLFDRLVAMISKIRATKSTAKKAMNHPVVSVTINDTVTAGLDDLKRAGNIDTVIIEKGLDTVHVVLAD